MQCSCRLNPLSAKASFQLWYPGGQRLKVRYFSWSRVKSPPKCFSNTKPTTIIASRNEKRCNAPVQRTRLVHSSSLRLSDQYRKCHGWLLFFAFSRAAASPSCSCTSTSTKTASCETVATSSLGNRLLKTRWFVDNNYNNNNRSSCGNEPRTLSPRAYTTLTSCWFLSRYSFVLKKNWTWSRERKWFDRIQIS